LLSASFACQAKDYFGNKSDQVAVLLGVCTIRGNWNEKLERDLLYLINGCYSQKNEFFYLQGRRTFEVVEFCNIRQYSRFLL
jgi:mitochondrial fission protein ELM1